MTLAQHHKLSSFEMPPDSVEWLKGEFLRVRKSSPSFSIRAFARTLGLQPGPLSEILSRKRPLTVKIGEKIALALECSPADRVRFLDLIKQESSAPITPKKPERRVSAFRQLSMDHYRLIADWYHFAVLSYLELDDGDCNRGKMAQRIGISTVEVTQAIERLLRLGLIVPTDAGFEPTFLGVRTSNDIAFEALRKAHHQILKIAQASLEQVPVGQRDITSITLAIDPKRIPGAKARIRRFRRALGRYLEGGKRGALYHLNVQLVPITLGEGRR